MRRDHASIEERDAREAPRSIAALVEAGRPVVLRGLAADWPAVRAADILAYLARFDGGAAIEVARGAPEIEGRLFYTADRRALNFERRPSALAAFLAELGAAATLERAPTLAAQAVAVREALPGFEQENRIGLLQRAIGPRIWIGNRVVVATHHDQASNLAVVVAGRRRFTLFPPDQAANLHIGPFEFTPAGTPVSLFDPEAPDLARYPRAAEALASAQTAELRPGDALYIPHMWWHHVRSLDAVGVLVNYWWNEAAAPQPGLAPSDAMVHAILAFADLPEEQRAAWRAMFDQFVFGAPETALAEFAPEQRGLRGRLGPEVKARLRRQLGSLMAR